MQLRNLLLRVVLAGKCASCASRPKIYSIVPGHARRFVPSLPLFTSYLSKPSASKSNDILWMLPASMSTLLSIFAFYVAHEDKRCVVT